ncbi:MAG TPA: hypothetical protein VN442_13665, partial [Bryobacteraceae bacterium]|nr:hypothetical protein [Bryobacteraceae bacterium]
MFRILQIAALALALAPVARPSWIWTTSTDPAPKNRFTYFRKVVTLDRLPADATFLFSADSNARLWINGTLVCRKVTRYHEQRATADTVDAAPYLRKGANVLLVLHHNWGPIVTFQRSGNVHAGLYLESPWIRTDASWRWRTAPEFAAHDQQIVGVTGDHRIRYPQVADGRLGMPEAVHDPAFDDAAWQPAAEVKDGPWPAKPAPVEIPLQREIRVEPTRVLAAGRLADVQPLSDDPLSMAAGIRKARCRPVQ